CSSGNALKNNKSFKTVALWIFLIVAFVAIYQMVSRSGGGKHLDFSEFISEALPPSYDTRQNDQKQRYRVTAYGDANDALIEYALPPVPPMGEAGPVESKTRGDLSMQIGPPGSAQSLFSALSERGISVECREA